VALSPPALRQPEANWWQYWLSRRDEAATGVASWACHAPPSARARVDMVGEIDQGAGDVPLDRGENDPYSTRGHEHGSWFERFTDGGARAEYVLSSVRRRRPLRVGDRAGGRYGCGGERLPRQARSSVQAPDTYAASIRKRRDRLSLEVRFGGLGRAFRLACFL